MSSPRELTTTELPIQNYRHEYNSSMVDFVDFDVMNAALSTIRGFPTGEPKPCTLSRMHDICNRNGSSRNGTRWTNFINKRTPKGVPKKVAFPLVRECADFMALPPWLLLSPRGNKDLQERLETLPPHVPKFVLASDYAMAQSEKQFRIWEHNNKNVSPDVYWDALQKSGISNSSRFYPQSNKDPYNRVTGPIEKILDLMRYMTDYHRTYSYGGDVILRGLTGAPEVTSTFRMAKGSFPSHGNLKDSDHEEEWWHTCWYILRCPSHLHNECVPYTEYVRNCFSDILDRYPIEIEVQDGEWITQVYSWHSHRIQSEVETLKKMIIKRIPDSGRNLTVLMERIVVDGTYTEYVTDFQESLSEEFISYRQFLMWICTDFGLSKNSMKAILDKKPKYRRHSNTISVLLNQGILHEGTRLIFGSSHLHSELKGKDLTAVVVITGNRPSIKWNVDGQFYSVSGLAAKIFELSGVKPPTRINGNKYFYIVGDSESLYEKRSKLTSPSV